MNKRNACIIAAGVSIFGERQAHLVDLFQEAAKRCLDDVPGSHKLVQIIVDLTRLLEMEV